MSNIAIIGTGLMGLPIARRLQAAGHTISVWNRTPAKADEIAQAGGAIANSIQEAFEFCDIAISMLANGSVLEDAVFSSGAWRALRPGSLFIDMSSIPPEQSVTHAGVMREHGIACLDAPVSGGTAGAANGTLSIFVGGSEADFVRATPTLSCLGRPYLMGPPGSGQIAKLANQIIVAGTLGAVAEGLAFAEGLGLRLQEFHSALSGGFADSRVLQEHGKRILARDFSPGAPNDIFLKDLNTIFQTAEAADQPVPFATLARSYYEHLVKSGRARLDHSSIFLEFQKGEPQNS